MKKKIISISASLMLAMGVFMGATGVSVATAEPAQAATYQNCYTSWQYYYFGERYGYWKYLIKRCYVNYSWWEETFQGKQDAWHNVKTYKAVRIF